MCKNDFPLLLLILEQFHSMNIRKNDAIRYDIARMMINSRIRVKDEFYNPRMEYLLFKLLDGKKYEFKQEEPYYETT